MVEGIADSNSRLPLRDITDLAGNRLKEPLGHTTVDEIFGDSFKLVGARKKPFWRRGQKAKRKDSASRQNLGLDDWRNVVFVYESTIEYNPYPVGGRIRVRASEELEEKNLQASFKSGRTNVGIYAAIAYGRRTKLIMVRKRTPAEPLIDAGSMRCNTL